MHCDLFTSIAIIVASAAVLVKVAQRLGQSSILAYLALGLLLGRSGFQVLESREALGELADLGVVFLLFFVGLDFHLDSLKSLFKLAIGGAGFQVAATTVVFWGVGMLCGWSARESGLIALCVALSSTAIVMKAFEDRRESDSSTAIACTAVLIGQDLIALLAMAVLPLVLGTGNSGPLDLAPLPRFGLMIVGLPLLFIVARRALPWLFKSAAVGRSEEGFGLWSLAACLVVAALAHLAGASVALGAFFGGLVVADTPFAHQVRADLTTIRNYAIGFFFVTIGMLLDLRFAAEHAVFLIVALVLVTALKTVIAAGTLVVFRRPVSLAAGAGLALSQIGEFALVLPVAARESGILARDRAQLLVSLTVATMIAAPAVVARSRRFGTWIAERIGGPLERFAARPAPADDDVSAPPEPRTRAIVVGYGPVGRAVSRVLIRFGVEPSVVDLHLGTILKLQSIGRIGVYGDAARREVLIAAGARESRYLLVTLPEFRSRAAIVATAHAINPDLVIITRSRYLNEQPALSASGADLIASEEREVAAALARLLLCKLGISEEQVDGEMARVHDEITTRSGFTRAMPLGDLLAREGIVPPKDAG